MLVKALIKLIGSYKFNSILMRNFMIIFLLLSVPLGGFSFYIYQFNQSVMEKEIAQASLSNISRIKDTVDLIFGEADRLSLRLHSDPAVAAIIKGEISPPFDYSSLDLLMDLQGTIKLSELTNHYIASIQVYFQNHQYMLTSSEGRSVLEPQAEWWNDSYSRHVDKHKVWLTTFLDRLDHISHFRSFTDVAPGAGGAIVVNIDGHKLEQIITNTIQSQSVFIVNETGEVMYNQHAENNGKHLGLIEPGILEVISHLKQGVYSEVMQAEEQERVVSITKSDYRGWKYVSIIPLTEYQERLSDLNRLSAILFTFSIASALILAFVISVKMYRPIMRIITLIENKDSDLFLNSPYHSSRLDEIKFIASNIIQTKNEKDELMDELVAKYQALRKAQAIALQSQINPHFLFNTLETINWKVLNLAQGDNEASEMIKALSKLLRYSLDTEEEFISIGSEMAFIKLYLEIQRRRYGDKLSVQWKFAHDISQYRILKLLVQPIVENAIYHGIKPGPNDGVITITGHCKANTVIIKIRDNGVGMKRSTVERLNADFHKEGIKENEHIGLVNVNQRIQLMFGRKYGLKVRSVLGGGTLVEMTLPKITG